VDAPRSLVVTADDFGIGPTTSEAILDLAARGLVTATVLLVNAPCAEEAVRHWRRAERRPELGWHPCLTMDRPVLPAAQIPSLVRPDGTFRPLGGFVRRLLLGRVRVSEVEAELRAQYRRFRELVGRPPAVVNTHHHIQVFPPVREVLLRLLTEASPLPYLRRIQEPWPLLAQVPGARGKRAFLNLLGRRAARRQAKAGFPGNDWLVGVTDPGWVTDPDYLARWLARVPGRVVELACHPGYLDPSLIGRDGDARGGQLLRRVHELERLLDPRFRDACRRAGFVLVSPSELTGARPRRQDHAARRARVRSTADSRP
jgi:chitin disaccharide deacetylase